MDLARRSQSGLRPAILELNCLFGLGAASRSRAEARLAVAARSVPVHRLVVVRLLSAPGLVRGAHRRPLYARRRDQARPGRAADLRAAHALAAFGAFLPRRALDRSRRDLPLLRAGKPLP